MWQIVFYAFYIPLFSYRFTKEDTKGRGVKFTCPRLQNYAVLRSAPAHSHTSYTECFVTLGSAQPE